MSVDELTVHGSHVMTVCNACRYCEQFCAVFPAMEQRLTFGKVDLSYLSNLCHNCGECLQACQYAPPHEFGINVPKSLAELRVRSYEDYCWPACLGAAFRRNDLATGLGLAALMMAAMAVALVFADADVFVRPAGAGDFYAVMSHNVMVALFGGVSLFVALALGIGTRRAIAAFESSRPSVRSEPRNGSERSLVRGVRDALSLRYLHESGADCVSEADTRSRWRRWFHHATFYGFVLCIASTSVAAIYHSVFGWIAPHAYTSLPVILGIIGGLGLVVGPAGLWVLRGRRDPASRDPEQRGMDDSFIALLFLTSTTGLALLMLRQQAVMAVLLVVHLGAVLALILTLPYGKFVHGLYRTAALVKFARENPESADT